MARAESDSVPDNNRNSGYVRGKQFSGRRNSDKAFPNLFCHHFLRSERLCFQIFSGKTSSRTFGIYSSASGLRCCWGVLPKWFLRLVVFVLFPAFHIPLPPDARFPRVKLRSIPVRDGHTIVYILRRYFFSCA